MRKPRPGQATSPACDYTSGARIGIPPGPPPSNIMTDSSGHPRRPQSQAPREAQDDIRSSSSLPRSPSQIILKMKVFRKDEMVTSSSTLKEICSSYTSMSSRILNDKQRADAENHQKTARRMVTFCRTEEKAEQVPRIPVVEKGGHQGPPGPTQSLYEKAEAVQPSPSTVASPTGPRAW